jgi:hypothetical protein
MTSHDDNITSATSVTSATGPRSELRGDQRTEDRAFWKGLLALAVTVLVAVARQRWWT